MIYFAYGSNLHLEQMMRRCPDAEPLTQAILYGYRLTYRRGVATIEADKRDRVYGALYRISKIDLKALDRYEGYPRVYYRDTIQVEARGMGSVRAITYKMHKHFEFSPPRTGCYEIIQEGYRNWGLPTDSLEKSLENLGSVGLSAGRGITLLKSTGSLKIDYYKGGIVMKLFEENIRMAYHIASRFTPNTIVDMEDIKQLALIGLYKACQNYKDDLGFKFSTYAYKVMRNEILKELTKHNVYDSIDEMEYDVIDESYNPEEEYIGSLQRFSSVLTNQEYEVVLLTVQGYSQKEMSLRLNLSQSQISRVFIKAKKKIKEALEDGCVINVE